MKTRKLPALIAVFGLVAGACGSTGATPTVAPTNPPAATPTTAVSQSAAASPSAASSGLTVDSFDSSFSAMSQLSSVVSAGTGNIAVILPDATTSGRYVAYDAPYFKMAFDKAGYSSSQYKIDNAQGSDATELSLAEADIAAGVKVLIMDPLNSTVGKNIQQKAAAAGVKLISYDRATFQGTDTYYVSFNNVNVGKLIGQGIQQCVKDWNVSNPMVYELDGGQDTDPNAIDFAKGYNSVLWGQSVAQVKAGTTNNGWTLVKEEIAPGWDNAKGKTIAQQALTANKNINVTVEANDGLAGAMIQDLQALGAKPKTVPTGGQDATLSGMAYILQGWQCGSVYKPIYLETQATVALATYLRAGQTPPSGLLNGTTTDPTNSSVTEPAVLLTPVWVNAANMQTTVIKDQFIKVADLCKQVGQAVCTAAGIQ